MSSELEDAIVNNVTTRGMDFMSLHCTCWSPDYKKLNEIMGIEGIMHGFVQTVHLHQYHPITKGIGDFALPLDENFEVKLINTESGEALRIDRRAGRP